MIALQHAASFAMAIQHHNKQGDQEILASISTESSSPHADKISRKAVLFLVSPQLLYIELLPMLAAFLRLEAWDVFGKVHASEDGKLRKG